LLFPGSHWRHAVLGRQRRRRWTRRCWRHCVRQRLRLAGCQLVRGSTGRLGPGAAETAQVFRRLDERVGVGGCAGEPGRDEGQDQLLVDQVRRRTLLVALLAETGRYVGRRRSLDCQVKSSSPICAQCEPTPKCPASRTNCPQSHRSNQLAGRKSGYLPRGGNREYYLSVCGECLYNILLFGGSLHATPSRSIITVSFLSYPAVTEPS
jgi:hypothetical protein